MDVKEIVCKRVYRIHMAHDRVQQNLLQTAPDFMKGWDFLTN
jgi:hypothetical protein